LGFYIGDKQNTRERYSLPLPNKKGGNYKWQTQ